MVCSAIRSPYNSQDCDELHAVIVADVRATEEMLARLQMVPSQTDLPVAISELQRANDSLNTSRANMAELKSLCMSLKPHGISYDKPIPSVESQLTSVSNAVKVSTA